MSDRPPYLDHLTVIESELYERACGEITRAFNSIKEYEMHQDEAAFVIKSLKFWQDIKESLQDKAYIRGAYLRTGEIKK